MLADGIRRERGFRQGINCKIIKEDVANLRDIPSWWIKRQMVGVKK